MQTQARWTLFSTASTPAVGGSILTQTWCSPRRSRIRRTPPSQCTRWPRRTLFPRTPLHRHTARTRFLAASKGTRPRSTRGYYTDIGTWATDFKVSCQSASTWLTFTQETRKASGRCFLKVTRTQMEFNKAKNVNLQQRFTFSQQNPCSNNNFTRIRIENSFFIFKNEI